ncbi:unnamed protein product [Cuscuta epithymum]|uniref:Uncharacterized protein n=1 Tax=Cuscuta epithymum TaxID=186058 RepID=A0AAV0CZX6_9ASTE|nr:unnamed protein product [Cuscuta epithymum]
MSVLLLVRISWLRSPNTETYLANRLYKIHHKLAHFTTHLTVPISLLQISVISFILTQVFMAAQREHPQPGPQKRSVLVMRPGEHRADHRVHPHIAVTTQCLREVAREMRERGDPRDYPMMERIRNCLRRIGAEEAMDHDIITFENVDEGHALPEGHGQPSRPTGHGLHDDDTSHDTPMEPPSTVGSSYHAH